MADKQETATSRPARNSRQTNPAVTDTLKNIHDTTRRVSTAGNSERDKKYTNNAKNTENIMWNEGRVSTAGDSCAPGGAARDT